MQTAKKEKKRNMSETFLVSLIAILSIFVIVIHAMFIIFCSEKRQGEQCETNIAAIDMESQHVVKIQKRRKIFTRVFSMHCSFWAYAWIIFFIVKAAMWGGELDPAINLIGYIHLGGCVLVIWMETFHSWEFQYLSPPNMMRGKTCQAYIQYLKAQPLVMELTVVTYHDDDGTDHKEVKQFPFSHWEDRSPSPYTLNLDPGKWTKVKLSKHMTAGDSQTVIELRRMRFEMERKVKQLYPDSITEFSLIPEPAERFCGYWGRLGNESWGINRRVLYYSFSASDDLGL